MAAWLSYFGSHSASPSHLRLQERVCQPPSLPYVLGRTFPIVRLAYHAAFPHRVFVDPTWCRNINLLSIAYASRPRLRPD